MQSPSRGARKIDRTREVYERHPFGDFCYGERRPNYNRPLVSFLRGLSADNLICDIGCGAGFWLDVATRESPIPQERCIGIDLASASAAAALSRGFPVVCSDAAHLAIRSGAADTAVCNGVLHHTESPERVFAELVRITKPGGAIFVAVYSWRNPYFFLAHKVGWPLRFLHGHWGPRVVDIVWPVARCLLGAAGRLFAGVWLDDATAKTHLFDQIITPRARAYSIWRLRRLAARHGCTIETTDYTSWKLMVTAVIKTPGQI